MGAARFQFFPPVEGDNSHKYFDDAREDIFQETLRAVHALESSAQRVRAEADVSLSSKGPSPTSLPPYPLLDWSTTLLKTQQEGAGKFVPDVSKPLREVHVELVPSEERVGTKGC